MRIGISGAQGVGKTTLIDAVTISGYTKVKEVIRKMDVPINKDGTFESQLQIMTAHGINVQEKNIITDRSIIDSFAYGWWSYNNGIFTKQQFDLMEAYFKAILPWYDFHFYIPPEFPMEEDGIRDTDVVYRNEVDFLMNMIFSKYKISPHRLNGSVENRAGEFLEIVNRYM